ncbi:iron chelate uptake ABC transporter family permease subunit [Nocardia sp. NPDC058497]|uniref:iron chelate uptake ABC transporter family permease subunit n=1 Tax=Nocardia sp. NPDC058497 TaxID=3346529 RepID=UPI003661C6A1
MRGPHWCGWLLTVALLIAARSLSLLVGTKSIPADEVWQALSGPVTTPDHVTEYRLPRTVLGLLAGLALGVAGCLMQGLTRNPLADLDYRVSTRAQPSRSLSRWECSA